MDVNISEFFKVPFDYNAPQDTDLDGSTQYPNLNSIEFRNRQIKKTEDPLTFYEILEANEDQSTLLLATNSYNRRLWNGAVLGYKQFADVGKPNAELIRLPFDSNVTSIHFLDKVLVFFTTASGSVEFWSTQCEIRQKNGYNFFQVAKKAEHFGIVTAFSILGNQKKAVTGAMDGCLKVWKVEPCDLVSERTYRGAHHEVITAVSAKPKSNDMFASCSRDRFLSIWDLRSRLPIISLCKNEEFANTACLWSEGNGVEKLYLGDDTGTLYIYDPRKLNTFLATQRILDRPIHKLKMNPTNELIGVLGHTNTFKVINTSLEMDTIYSNSNAVDYVRDICWVNNKNRPQKSFISVGWSEHVKYHSIQPATS